MIRDAGGDDMGKAFRSEPLEKLLRLCQRRHGSIRNLIRETAVYHICLYRDSVEVVLLRVNNMHRQYSYIVFFGNVQRNIAA